MPSSVANCPASGPPSTFYLQFTSINSGDPSPFDNLFLLLHSDGVGDDVLGFVPTGDTASVFFLSPVGYLESNGGTSGSPEYANLDIGSAEVPLLFDTFPLPEDNAVSSGEILSDMNLSCKTQGNIIFYACGPGSDVGQTQLVVKMGTQVPKGCKQGALSVISAAKDFQTDWRDLVYVEACENPRLHQMLRSFPQNVSLFACLTTWNCSIGVGSVLAQACWALTYSVAAKRSA